MQVFEGIFYTVYNTVSEFAQKGLTGLLFLSFCALMFATLITILMIKINKVNTIKAKQLIKLLTVLGVFALSFGFVLLGSIIFGWNYIVVRAVEIAGIITVAEFIVYFVIDTFIITGIICLIKGNRKIKPKKVKKIVDKKPIVKKENKNVDNIITEFTRSWIKEKMNENSSLSRHDILVNNKKEYIDKLSAALKDSVSNGSASANKAFSEYEEKWK